MIRLVKIAFHVISRDLRYPARQVGVLGSSLVLAVAQVLLFQRNRSMDRSALISLIEASKEAEPSSLTDLLFHTTNPELHGEDAALAWAILEFFKSDEWVQSLDIHDNRYVENNKEKYIVDLPSLAAWTAWLVRAEADVAKAVDTLFRFLNTGQASATSYLLLGGLWSVKQTELPPDMCLARFDDFKPSRYAGELLALTEVKAFSGLDRPRCVLSMNHKVEGLVLSPQQQSERDNNWALFCFDRGARDDMAAIAECLCLIGPHPMIRVLDWCEIDTRTAPPGLEMDAHVGLVRMPYPTFMDGEDFSASRCRELVDAFRRLPTNLRRKVLVPIRRLNGAMRALPGWDEVDWAIGLGIALEALLVDESKGERPSNTIPRKGADILIEGDETRRADIERKLKRVYALRSAAMHSGTITSQDAREALTAGTLFAASLIRHEVLQLANLPHDSPRTAFD
jgi:hypothetical protein